MSVSVSLLLLAAQSSAWIDPAPSGRWAGSTAKLASELLPPEMAAEVVAHAVQRPIVQGGQPFSVEFTGRSRPTSGGFCERSLYYVHVGGLVERPDTGGRPVRSTSIRLGDCPSDSNAIFAHLNSSNASEAKQAIRWIEWAQRVARSKASLPFRLSCKTETGPDRCNNSGRKALTELPLDKIFIAMAEQRAPPRHWKLAVTETKPGQLLWDVEIDATPGKSSIDLTWKIPAPF